MTSEIFKMRISGSGIANNGLRALKECCEHLEDGGDPAAVKEDGMLYDAEAAISCLHDALLAVAQEKITPEQVRDFFWWKDDMSQQEYIGGVLKFDEDKPDAP